MNQEVPAGRAALWWACTTELGPDQLRLLSTAERERHRSYRRPGDRDRFLLGVSLSRTVLGGLTGVPASRVRIERDCPDCDRSHGRPRLADQPGGAVLDFSLSHAGRWAVLLVGWDVGVGVDVEWVQPLPDVALLARSVLSTHELARPGALEARNFFTQWVAKESAVKATGSGLRTRLDRVAVPAPAVRSGRTRLLDNPDTDAWLQRVTAPDGYVAAATTLSAHRVEIVEASHWQDAGHVLPVPAKSGW